jgi:hypothetical protein
MLRGAEKPGWSISGHRKTAVSAGGRLVAEALSGKTLELGEQPSHRRLLARCVVAMDSVSGSGFVDGGGELLGCLSSGVGVAGGDRVLRRLKYVLMEDL